MFSIHATASATDLNALSRQLSQLCHMPVQLVAQVDSSNQHLLDGAAQLPLHPQTPCALMAMQQTAGRGRRGRAWTMSSQRISSAHSTVDTIHPAFLASIGVRSLAPVNALGLLPLHMGVATVQALNRMGCAAQLKWPNDIVIATPQGMAKLGGILVEMHQLSGDQGCAVVMGMGINWHSGPQLDDKLTACVADYLSQAQDVVLASASLLNAMGLAWQRCSEQASCDFAAHDALYGQAISALSETQEVQHCIARGINAAGHLCMQLPNGQLRWLNSGEVSVRVGALA